MNASVEILMTQASIGSKTVEIGYHLPTVTIAERTNASDVFLGRDRYPSRYLRMLRIRRFEEKRHD